MGKNLDLGSKVVERYIFTHRIKATVKPTSSVCTFLFTSRLKFSLSKNRQVFISMISRVRGNAFIGQYWMVVNGIELLSIVSDCFSLGLFW